MRHLQRGQVMSSFVAVAAAAAVVIGLLVLFGTRDSGRSNAGPPNSPSPSSSAPSPGTPTSPETQPPVPTRPTAVAPTTRPTTVRPTTVQPTPTRTPTRTPERTEPVQRAPVEIYNNTTRRGLADRVAQRARAQGWQVTGVDNWIGRVITSTVYYPDGMRAAAQALAGDIGIGSTKPRVSNMKRDRLTVILTKDYSE